MFIMQVSSIIIIKLVRYRIYGFTLPYRKERKSKQLIKSTW